MKDKRKRMIQKIEINNFQSHQNSVLDFHPGINIIIGTSNEGKSAILRSIEWVVNNRPLGLSYISHWNITKDDKIMDQAIVKIIINDNEIIRKRSDDFNGYIVNGKKLETGSEVPYEIKNIFNFTDVNIQKQFDSPFLLSKGAGEVARYFNETIKIDDIDQMLSLAEKKKRKSKSDLKYIQEDLKETEDNLKKLEWIDEAGRLLKRIERINDRIKKTDDNINILDELLNKKINIEKRIKGVNLDSIKNYIDKINDLNNKLIEQNKIFVLLNELYDKKIEIEKRIKLYDKILKAKNIIDEINGIDEIITKQEKDIDIIESFICQYKDLKEIINDNEIKIKKLRKQLPSNCPLCGNIIDNLKGVYYEDK